MTANTLNALKGWPTQSAVDFAAPFASNIPSGERPIKAGSVVSLNSSGQFEVGIGTNKRMPMFLFASSTDPDIGFDTAPAANTKNAYVPMTPSGAAMALVAVGAYELVSTAFVAGSYAVNAMLTSPYTGSTNAGKLKVGTYGTDTIVGIVSRGLVDNGYGEQALAFWPHVIFPTPA
jgi:hypothetical protein